MSGTTEAFARVKIDALLKDAGWNLTDGSSVMFEYVLPDGTQADYALCDRQGCPMAALEAKRAGIDPITAQDQGRHFCPRRLDSLQRGWVSAQVACWALSKVGTEATWERGLPAERRVGERIEHALGRCGCAFAHDVKEALDGVGGNVAHVVLTGASVWVVKTTAVWLGRRTVQGNRAIGTLSGRLTGGVKIVFAIEACTASDSPELGNVRWESDMSGSYEVACCQYDASAGHTKRFPAVIERRRH